MRVLLPKGIGFTYRGSVGYPIKPPTPLPPMAERPVRVRVWHAPTTTMPRNHHVQLDGLAIAWTEEAVLVLLDPTPLRHEPREAWYHARDVERLPDPG